MGMVTIHSPGAARRTSPSTIWRMSSMERAAARDGHLSLRPSRSMWAWPSKSPGTASRPRRSIRRVSGPMSPAISSSVPRAAMRSPRIARAETVRERGSRVTILPPVSTRSAWSMARIQPSRPDPGQFAARRASPRPQRDRGRPVHNVAREGAMTEVPGTADVVVVGGGVHGASVAYHLARRKAGRVVLVERKFLASGPTGRSSALVRRFYAWDFLTRTASASADTFQHWSETIGGGDPGFRKVGVLWLAAPERAAHLRGNVERARELGVPV